MKYCLLPDLAKDCCYWTKGRGRVLFALWLHLSKFKSSTLQNPSDFGINSQTLIVFHARSNF